jgi:hypothetical protein
LAKVLFENAISQAKLAQRTSHLAGILWHQGETTVLRKSGEIREKFSVITETLRQELNIPEVPLIIGGLGD